MALYTAPTDNYRKVRPDDPQYIANLPTEIVFGTTLTGFVLGTPLVSTSRTIGKPERYPGKNQKNVFSIVGNLIKRITGCDVFFTGRSLIKHPTVEDTQSDTYQSEDVCDVTTSTGDGSEHDVKRIDEQVYNYDGTIEHWMYDSTVVAGQQLDDGFEVIIEDPESTLTEASINIILRKNIDSSPAIKIRDMTMNRSTLQVLEDIDDPRSTIAVDINAGVLSPQDNIIFPDIVTNVRGIAYFKDGTTTKFGYLGSVTGLEL